VQPACCAQKNPVPQLELLVQALVAEHTKLHPHLKMAAPFCWKQKQLEFEQLVHGCFVLTPVQPPLQMAAGSAEAAPAAPTPSADMAAAAAPANASLRPERRDKPVSASSLVSRSNEVMESPY
jgi:hypothetical protein